MSGAVQLAKHRGAHVAITASGAGLDLVRALGADEVFDRTRSGFSEHLRDFDAVLDTVGGASIERSYDVLNRGETLVDVSGDIDRSEADARGLTTIRQRARSDSVLQELTEYLATGAITPRIGRVHPLEEARTAIAALEDPSVHGKIEIVISIGDPRATR